MKLLPSELTELRAMYRMPYGFGPSAGPRRGPDGQPFCWRSKPHNRAVLVAYRTAPSLLQDLLPPGFSLSGDPIVVINVTYYKELPWLAGRGYAVLGVRFPAAYRGKTDRVEGPFLSVLWENMTDPIVTGRDELGYSKLFADIHEPALLGRQEYHGASWQGHRFVDVALSNLEEGDVPEVLANTNSFGTGVLHYKYIPATGDSQVADASYACFSPHGNTLQKTDRVLAGVGRVKFHQTRWDQMPTQYHIVNRLAELPVEEWCGAAVIESHGGKDLSDQRQLD